jgi:hypothetical protein
VASHGLGQDALVLARSMFEVQVALSWMLRTKTRLRSKVFTAYWAYQAEKWLNDMAQTDGFRRYARKGLKAAQQMYAAAAADLPTPSPPHKKHWNPGGLEGATKGLRSHLYATCYRKLSSHAHGADLASHLIPSPQGMATSLIPGDANLSESLDWARLFLWGSAFTVDLRFGLGHSGALLALRPEGARLMLRGLVKVPT